MKIILASSSPRRKELLSLMGVQFEIIKPVKDEDMTQKMSIYKLSEVLSKQKAQEVFDNLAGDRIVIGSDCMVFLKNKKIGKPKDRQDAFNMISSLSGNWHKVVTGLCVMVQKGDQTKTYLTHETTKVKFKKLDKQTIEDYLDGSEYMDKAGAYAVQGKSGMFIEKINGNISTVIGLPTNILHDILKQEKILK